jgi:hypothetical protein
MRRCFVSIPSSSIIEPLATSDVPHARRGRGRRARFQFLSDCTYALAGKTVLCRRCLQTWRTIEVGDHFAPIGAVSGAPRRVWEVLRLFRSQVDALDYADLVCVEEPSLRKSIGVAALSDAKQFARVSSPIDGRAA